MRLILVRHGESEWNAAGRVQGQADPGLSPAGREQARMLAPLVRAQEPGVTVTSDLRRAADTGRILVGGDPATDPAWRECGMGDWTGRSVDELYAETDGRFEAWREGQADPPGGETWDEMCERIAGAVRALRATGARRALAVTHGGPVRAACAVLAGLRPDQLVPVGNASMTIIELGPPARLVAFAVRPVPVEATPEPPADA